MKLRNDLNEAKVEHACSSLIYWQKLHQFIFFHFKKYKLVNKTFLHILCK